MSKILSVDVNGLRKAKRIAKARKGFYEIFYGFNGQRVYKVYYRTV